MFKKSRICTAALAALGGAVLMTSAPVLAQSQTVEVTGSRIKRADAEGSLPITVITREEIEASGSVTVAEFARNLTFASTGNQRPASGNTAQSVADISLRGLGSFRTLVLLDGRRVVRSPATGQQADLNSIPMAAIERIEVLTDGASAVYGSDAIGGVVNFITRKDLEGGVVTLGKTDPSQPGGGRMEASAVFGIKGNKGRALVGVSSTRRDIVYTNSRPWGEAEALGSSFSNNFFDPALGLYTAVPGGCDRRDLGFFTTTVKNAKGETATQCLYDYNKVAADEAEVANQAFFMFGETQISKDWSATVQASVSRVTSFGRYAPTPSSPFLGQSFIVIDKNSPNNPTNGVSDVRLRHRFAAAGNRDTNIDNNVYDTIMAVQGSLGDWSVDAGVRYSLSKYQETGRGYIVANIAKTFIDNGTYNIYKPFENSASTLAGMTATIGRDGKYLETALFASGSVPLFKLGGGRAMLVVGGEAREEEYADIYDSLSEGGQIVGSAGNSAGGGRKVKSIYAEMVLPITKTLELDLAARHEEYSDYGKDFSPKASLSFKPMPNLKLRGSVGKGFRAPTLDILTAKETFSATSVVDARTAVAEGRPATTSIQVNEWRRSNPELKSEKSNQFSVGGVWDVTPSVSVKADYWNIELTNSISLVSAPSLVARSNGTSPLPIPAGLGVTRDPVSGAITRVDAGYANEGKINAAGVDISVVGRYKLGSFGSIKQELTLSHLEKWISTSGFDAVGSYGVPRNRAVVSTNWSRGRFDATWNINVIGSSEDEGYRLPTYVTHDIQVGMNLWKGGKLVLGAVNATEKLPVIDYYTGRPMNMDLYDYYGRQVYFRFKQAF